MIFERYVVRVDIYSLGLLASCVGANLRERVSLVAWASRFGYTRNMPL